MGGPGGPCHPQNSALLLQCPFPPSTPLLQGASEETGPQVTCPPGFLWISLPIATLC